MSKKVTKESVTKSLSRLTDMAKSQIYHTPSNSDPGVWAGSKEEEEDEHESMIDDNGTDYNGVRKSLAEKVRKSQALTPAEVAIAEGKNPLPAIGAKLAKGQKLTPAENWAMKGGYDEEAKMYKAAEGPCEPSEPGEDHGAKEAPDTHAGSEEGMEEIEEVEEHGGMAKKSLSKSVRGSQDLSKGLELSPFLAEFANAFAAALDGAEARIKKSVLASVEGVLSNLTKGQSEQNDFNKSLAEAVVGIGKLVQGQADQALQQASMPASGPKSQLRALSGGQDMNKSIAGGNNLTKSQIVDTMCDLVKSNQLDSKEVVKFESTGELSPGVRALVSKHLAGSR